MTESEWLSSTDPAAMLASLTRRNTYTDKNNPPPGGISDRKLRLFACSCCRQVWDGQECDYCNGRGYLYRDLLYGDNQTDSCERCGGTGRTGVLTDPHSRRAVEVAERYADGEATEHELAIADHEATEACRGKENSPGFATGWVAHREHFLRAAERLRSQNGVMFTKAVGATQAALLRCIVGNPFAAPVPRWRFAPGDAITWATPNVLALARAAYAERCPADALAVLADALEDSGCDNEDVLRHLRGWERCPGTFAAQRCTIRTCPTCRETGWIPLRSPHVRGCWAVDILLNKS